MTYFNYSVLSCQKLIYFADLIGMINYSNQIIYDLFIIVTIVIPQIRSYIWLKLFKKKMKKYLLLPIIFCSTFFGFGQNPIQIIKLKNKDNSVFF